MRILTGTILAVAVVASAHASVQDYSITVPVMNEPGLEKFGGREKILEELQKLGALRVNLCLDKYVSDGGKRADVMRALKENSDWFKARGLSTCAWIWAFWGDEEMLRKFHRITDKNGSPRAFLCPLDEDFRKFAADYVADIARSGVDMILYDDDLAFRNDYTGRKVSCLCEKHLAAYRRELGENVSADEFNRRVLTGGRNRWRDAWMKVNGDALLTFAKDVRAAAERPWSGCGTSLRIPCWAESSRLMRPPGTWSSSTAPAGRTAAALSSTRFFRSRSRGCAFPRCVGRVT